MTSLSARLGKCLLVTSLVAAPLFAGAEVIFEENFDDQPDWHSAMYSTSRVQVAGSDRIPLGWSAIRQDPSWGTSVGYPGGRESIEILQEGSKKARGGTGKSFVAWRDSTDDQMWRWNSDSILAKHFEEGHEEIYARFWIKFSPDWTPLGQTGSTKLFRISHWNEEGSIFGYGNDRFNGPVLFWNYEANDYGARISLTKRGYPIAENYTINNPPVPNWPRSQGPLNFNENIRDLDGDGLEDQSNVSLLNLITNEPLVGPIVSHDEVWGDRWHKIEFHVRMNSRAGALDGVLRMWIDDQLVVENVTMPWIGYGADSMPKWNIVALGGNSHFHAYPNSDRRQEWYSIDNVLVRSSLPPERLSDQRRAPSPPQNISIN